MCSHMSTLHTSSRPLPSYANLLYVHDSSWWATETDGLSACEVLRSVQVCTCTHIAIGSDENSRLSCCSVVILLRLLKLLQPCASVRKPMLKDIRLDN